MTRRTLAITFAALLTAANAAAQQTVAPTDERVGPVRGANTDGYNVVNSFEVGYRFRQVGGDLGKFRSDVNLRNGVSLLSGQLLVNSREGHGRLFDEIVLTTQGLGNDPYEYAVLRIQKNRLYRYDLMWRRNDYYNPALPLALGEHFIDTTRLLQDHDLTLLPDSAVKFFVGYTRNTQTGPALTTVQLFDSGGDEFPLFADVRRRRNEYRVGNEIKLFGFRLNWMHGWDDFKEDTPISLQAPSAGNHPSDDITLNRLTRAEPYHGTSPYWRVALFKEGKGWYAANGRFTYTAGRRAFILDESAFGTGRFGVEQNRQILTYGDANRPVATGNLTFSLFPGSRASLTNETSIYNVRTDGNSYYRSLDNGTLDSEFVNFQYLGIRTIANDTSLNVRLNPALGLFAGYTYSNRRIRSIEQVANAAIGASALTADQTNQLHAGTFGVRVKPVKPLTIVLDGEIGRADRPFAPISDRNYHLLGARIQYRTKSLSFSAHARAHYNTNSVSLSAFSSRTRDYAASVSWTPRPWFALDASYSKMHLDTIGGIAYFRNFDLITGDRSFYISNIHSGNLTAHFDLKGRADLFVGFTRVQDVGDGRSTPAGAGTGSALPAFQAAQTFPLNFQSPMARLSIRIGERLRWNAGYQYYGYSEDFSTRLNYRAHTGYTSLLWSF
jgi:hypothetical protein